VHTPDSLPRPGICSQYWRLSDNIVFLNHGSFGACPESVMRYRESLIRRIESDPMEFLLADYRPFMASVLNQLSAFTGAEPDSLVFVENTTTGINTVLGNIPLKSGDDILVTDQEYFSSRNSLAVNASRKGASVIQVKIPFPVASDKDIVSAFADAVTPRTKFALIDHIVSSTGMIMPVKEIIDLLSNQGIGTIVDGAHGPGQIALNLKDLGCLAYVGNCHKWLCAPRSSAILYVNPVFQKDFLPLVVSHLPAEFDTDLPDYQVYFMWNGTPDPTPALCAGYSIDFMQGLHSEGWPGVMNCNREMVLNARRVICSALEVDPPCPDSMVGSMAAIPLSEPYGSRVRAIDWLDPLQKWLKREKGIVVPVTEISLESRRIIRISAQLYNSPEQYLYLAESLMEYRNL